MLEELKKSEHIDQALDKKEQYLGAQLLKMKLHLSFQISQEKEVKIALTQGSRVEVNQRPVCRLLARSGLRPSLRSIACQSCRNFEHFQMTCSAVSSKRGQKGH